MLQKKDENALRKLFQPIVGVSKRTLGNELSKPRAKAMQQKTLQSRLADWHFYYCNLQDSHLGKQISIFHHIYYFNLMLGVLH